MNEPAKSNEPPQGCSCRPHNPDAPIPCPRHHALMHCKADAYDKIVVALRAPTGMAEREEVARTIQKIMFYSWTGDPSPLSYKCADAILSQAAPVVGVRDDKVREAIQQAYGILWRDTSNSMFSRDARKRLFETLTHEERRAGIAWAMEAYGPMSDNEMIAADIRVGVFPAKSTTALAVPPQSEGSGK